MSTTIHVTNWDGALPSTAGNVTAVDFGIAVLLYIPPGISGSAIENATIDMVTNLPPGLRPTQNRSAAGTATSGGQTENATYDVGSDGSISVRLNSGDNFSDSGNNGLPAGAISYLK